MKIAPTPWNAAHDGHGGICLDDAQGRQIGFLSARPEQDAHAELFKAAPALVEALRDILMHIGKGREDGVEWVCEPIHSDEIRAAREALAMLPR